VFGSHRGPSGPNTVFRGAGWQTPLGRLDNAVELATSLAQKLDLDDEPVRPVRFDNAVEVHLPFVKYCFPHAELLMLGVAASEIALSIGREVGRAVREAVRRAGRDAVFVGSTDLTHYGPNYGFEPVGRGPSAVTWVRDENDRGFLDALLRDDAHAALDHAITHASACGPGAAVAAVEAVRSYAGEVHPTLLCHYTSHDVHPDSSFVGYATLAF
jgi:hypothetical protein